MERYSRKDAENAFDRLCRMMGKRLAEPEFRLESPEPSPQLHLGTSSAEMLTRLQMRAELRARRIQQQ